MFSNNQIIFYYLALTEFIPTEMTHLIVQQVDSLF